LKQLRSNNLVLGLGTGVGIGTRFAALKKEVSNNYAYNSDPKAHPYSEFQTTFVSPRADY
jgi:hypothetical protein